MPMHRPTILALLTVLGLVLLVFSLYAHLSAPFGLSLLILGALLYVVGFGGLIGGVMNAYWVERRRP